MRLRSVLSWITLITLLFAVGASWGCRSEEESDSPSSRSESSQDSKTEEEKEPSTALSYKSFDNRVPVLMYHDIIAKRTKDSVWFDITVDQFKEQLDWIAENKLTPISVDQLYKHLTEGASLPENPIVLTFDDNYQGFFDNAYPLLKEKGYPSAMFVHTKFVGDKTGAHPKMSWETLKQLVEEKLVTIGSHTVTHPADITLLSNDEQKEELEASKKEIETQLGIDCEYLAYPDGKNNPITQMLAKEAGYTLAFSTESGMAEESPNIFSVKRYIANKYEEAWEQRTKIVTSAPAAIFESPIQDGPITYEFVNVAAIKLALIKGGIPLSRHTLAGRMAVGEFVTQNEAVAGINGTFFSMAAVAGTSNEMIGPVFTQVGGFEADTYPDRINIIRNRPMLIWNEKKMAIVPFVGEFLNQLEGVQSVVPEAENAFVGGAWIVHEGKPAVEDQLLAFGPKDLMDPRRRVFVGMMPEGTMVFGASIGSVSTEKLAQAAAEAGVREAVLLDSGFSTSLVYGNKVIASGHSTPTEPSRPVPHAILLKGKLAQNPDEIDIPQPSKSDRPRKKKRRR